MDICNTVIKKWHFIVVLAATGLNRELRIIMKISVLCLNVKEDAGSLNPKFAP